MQQQLPLTNEPNQEFQMTLDINGSKRSFKFLFVWNAIAGYWVFSVTDVAEGELVLDSIPLVCGSTSTYDIFRQLGYLGIGSAFLVPSVEKPVSDSPLTTNLLEEFALVWDDN